MKQQVERQSNSGTAKFGCTRPTLLLTAFSFCCFGQTVPQVRLEMQLGHSDAVQAAAFSPDGKLAITGSAGLITLWDLESRRQIYQVRGDWRDIRSLAFPVNDRFLISSPQGGSSLYDLNTGNPLQSAYRALDSCANGSLVLTYNGGDNGTILDFISGKVVQSLPPTIGKTDAFLRRRLTCSAGRQFALIAGQTASGGWEPQFWDLTKGRIERSLGDGNQSLVLMDLAFDGRIAATVGQGDSVIHIWDTSSGKELRTFAGLPGLPAAGLENMRQIFEPKLLDGLPSVSALVFSPDGKLLAGGGLGYTIIWDVTSGKEVSMFGNGNGGIVEGLAFSPDGSRILIGTSKGGVRVLDVAMRDRPVAPMLAKAMPGAPLVPGGIIGNLPRAPLSWSANGGANANSAVAHKTPPVPEKPYEPPAEFRNRDEVLRANLSGSMSAAGKECRSSPDGRYLFLLMNDQGIFLPTMKMPLLYLDLKTGRHGEWANVTPVSTQGFTADGRVMALGHVDGSVTIWDVSRHSLIRKIEAPEKPQDRMLTVGAPQVTAVATDGKTLLAGYRDGTLRTVNLLSGKTRIPHLPVVGFWFDEFSISADGKHRIVGASTEAGRLLDDMQGSLDPATLPSKGGLVALQGSDGKVIRSVRSKFPSRDAIAFTPDGKAAVIADGTSVSFYNAATGEKQYELPGSKTVRRLAVSGDGHRLLTSTLTGDVASWDLAARKMVWQAAWIGKVVSLGFAAGERRIVVSYSDGTSRFLDASSGQWMATLALEPDMSWVVAAPDGRFDASSFDQAIPLQWVVSDAPLKPLPIEMFMRNYFEPGLLTRVLAGDRLPRLPRIAQLNRHVPEVVLLDVTPEADTKDEVRVRAEITEARDVPSGQTSGARNLRLFRNGRLVARAPAEDGAIELRDGKATVELRHIRVIGSRTSFSIYAFNNNDVKTPTKEYSYFRGALVPMDDSTPWLKLSSITLPQHRAWVITIGVGTAAAQGLSLRFAVNDAIRLRDDLTREFAQSGQFKQVIQVPLISDTHHPAGASKTAIQKILADLASTGTHPAQPDDLIVISFSGHGYADRSGRFYLIPSDAGKGLTNPFGGSFDRLLAESVSSDELSHWLQDVDAGQVALILDTCQSASSVEGEGFRPGPLGIRGLGQLAYDKGLVILVAAQADSVALESGKLEQGLLSYALTHDGLESSRADWQPQDGKIGLLEWLRYAVDRVPKLWREVSIGSIQDSPATRVVLSRGVRLPPPDDDAGQQPILFDFSGLRTEELIRHPQPADWRMRGGQSAGVKTRPAEVVTDYTKLDESVMPTLEADQKMQLGIVRSNPRDGQPYVWIPPGKFNMGCSPDDKDCDEQEIAVRQVTITNGFWMGQTPVTQEAYYRIMGSNPSSFEGGRLPVGQVYWSEAEEYCGAVGMRLPTEGEWEYGARARDPAFRYGDLDAVAWYRGNSGNRPHPVGEKLPNAFGLFDMLGNVNQWVADLYGLYIGQEVFDPQGPRADSVEGLGGLSRTVRGASYQSDQRRVRVSARSGRLGGSPGDPNIGFRCAGE